MSEIENFTDVKTVRPNELFMLTAMPRAQEYEKSTDFTIAVCGYIDDVIDRVQGIADKVGISLRDFAYEQRIKELDEEFKQALELSEANSPLQETTTKTRPISDLAIEIRDGYSDMATKTLTDVFTPKVVHEWSGMNMEQRALLLNEYAQNLGKAQDIDIKGIIIDDLYARYNAEVKGINSGDGILYLDYRNIQNPEKFVDILDTVTHEARHQLQYEAVANPERFNIPAELINNWAENLPPQGYYINGAYDPEGYWLQTVEVDARTAAVCVLEAWRNSLQN